MCRQESLSQHIINPGALETVVDAPTIRHLPNHLRRNSVVLNTLYAANNQWQGYSQKN
jgi:hypothetical protein